MYSAFSTLPVRTVVALVGGPAILYAAYLGGWPLFLFALLLSFLGSIEFARVAHSAGVPTQRVVLVLSSVAFPACVFACAIIADGGPLLQVFGLLVLAVLALVVVATGLRGRVEDSLRRAGSTFFGAVYVGGMSSLLLVVRSSPCGERLLPVLFLGIWACDVFAYFAGVLFGRRKLAPSISPLKTWEGAISGGIACVATFAVARAYALQCYDAAFVVALGAVVAVVGQLGDLAESAFKRAAHLKDSSSIIPGHGGVLDRFDGLLVSLPAVTVLVSIYLYA